MGASDTWNVETNILVDENETFSLPAEFHFKNSEIYHLLIMANLSLIFILIIEVALRRDRKCQKGIYTYVIKWCSLILYLQV